MDAQRLLGMLNGGALSPPPAAQSPPQNAAPASLQSLLSQLQSPPPPQHQPMPPAHQASPQPPSGSADIAEMLRGAGMLPNVPQQPSHHLSGMTGPNHPRVVSSGGNNNAQSLLAALMSGSNPGSAVPSPAPGGIAFTQGQPVINHASPQGPLGQNIPLPTSPPPAADLAAPMVNKSAQKPKSHSPAPPTAVTNVTAAATTNKQEANGNASSESASHSADQTNSKFTFISPFDAFDMAPTPPPQQQGKTAPAPPAAAVKSEKADVRAPSTSQPDEAKLSAAGPPPVLYPTQRNTGVECRPIALYNKPEFIFNLAVPRHSGFVGKDDGYELTQISTVKTNVESTGLQRQRKIASSKTYISYAVNKGKIRIIHYQSGANSAVNMENDTSPSAKVAELAACDQWVAAVGNDSTLNIWTVSHNPNADELDIAMVVKKPRHALNGQPLRGVRVVTTSGVEVPLLFSDNEVSILKDSVVSGGVQTSFQPQKFGDLVTDVSVSPEGSRFAVLEGHARLSICSVAHEGRFDLNLNAPQHGKWRSVTLLGPIKQGQDVVGDVVVLGSTEGEYVLQTIRHGSTDQKSNATVASVFYMKNNNQPEDGPGQLTSLAAFDPNHSIFWIQNWARASAMVIKLSEDSSNFKDPKFVSFVEVPIGTSSDLTVNLSDEENGTLPSIIYRKPQGFWTAMLSRELSASIDKVKDDMLTGSKPASAAGSSEASKPQAVAVEPQSDTPTTSKPPVQSQPELVTPPAKQDKTTESKVDVGPTQKSSHAGPSSTGSSLGISPADYSKLESLVSRSVSQALKTELPKVTSHHAETIETLKSTLGNSNETLQQDISQVLTKVVRAEMGSLLTASIERETRQTVLPVLQASLKEQVEKHVGDKLAASIVSSVETTVMAQVERALIPHLGRTFTSTLSPAVDKSVRGLVENTLVPQFVAAVELIPAQVHKTIHQEMLDIRKDVMIEQAEQASTLEAALSAMSTSLVALTEQTTALTREIDALKSAAASAPRAVQPTGFPPNGLPLPHHTPNTIQQQPLPLAQQQQQQQSIVSPRPVLAPNVGALQQLMSGPEEDAEDLFLKTFSTFSDQDLVQFVMARMPKSSLYLPAPQEGPSPLSQAVLLTMVHRLSRCLEGRSTHSPEYQALMTWIFRAANMIQPRDETIQGYFGGVKKTLEDTFRQSIDQLNRSGDRSAATTGAVQLMQQVIGVLNRP